MEVIWIGALSLDWWVPAVCDVIALSALVGITLIVGRAARPVPVRAAAVQEMAAPPKPEFVPDAPAPGTDRPARADVKRALAAIGRWEDSYRSGRGVAELARFVKSQTSREASGR